MAAGWVLVSVLRETDDAERSLDRLRDDLTVDALFDGTADRWMERLRADLVDIGSDAGSPVLEPLRVVPGGGRQLSSAEALVDAGLDVSDVGLALVDRLRPLSREPLPTGVQRLEFVDEVRRLLRDAGRALEDVDLGPDGPLLPPLADARNEATAAVGDLRLLLERGEAVGASVRRLLEGGDFLLLAANNAEMRAGSGMLLRAGPLRTSSGELEIGELVPTEDLRLDAGAVDAGSTTYEDLWGFLAPTEEWRNLATSPRFDVTAELAARMWEACTGDRPDGVIAVDAFALAALLRATGPVVADGKEVAADDVVPLVLHDQYDVFADVDPTVAHASRRDALGALAAAVFEAISAGAVDPVELLVGLREAVGGRHLMVWSPDPTVQAGWEAAGLAGTLQADSVMLSVLNRGANKLDPFLRTRVAVEVGDPGPGGTRPVRMDISLRNEVAPGEVAYVAGPDPRVPSVDSYGDYSGIVSVTLPGSARNARIEGVRSLEVARPDGPVITLASKVVLDAGGRRTLRVRFDLPTWVPELRIEPSARPEPTRWRIGEIEVDDRVRHTVSIER